MQAASRPVDVRPARRAFAWVTTGWLLTFAVGCRSNGSTAEVSAEPVIDRASVRFVIRRAQVGERFEIDEHTTSDFVIDLAGKTHTVHREAHRQRKVEVLAVIDGNPTRARVAYPVNDNTERDDGVDLPREVNLLEGRAYLVSRRDGGPLEVAASDGGPVGEAERAPIALDFDDLGRVGATESALASKPRFVGDALQDVAVPLMKRFAQEGVVGGQPDMPVTMDLVLARVDQGVATLSHHTTLEFPRGGTTMKMDTHGAFRVAVDAVDSVEMADATMSGTITLTGATTGHGTITQKLETTR